MNTIISFRIQSITYVLKLSHTINYTRDRATKLEIQKKRTSSTEDPTAQDRGLPPYVLKWRAPPITAAISGVVTTAARGKPLPIPLAIVTENENRLVGLYFHDIFSFLISNDNKEYLIINPSR